MASPSARPIASARVGVSSVLLVGALVLFGLTTEFRWEIAILIGGAGAAAAIALRVVSHGRSTNTAVVVALLTIGVLALAATDSWSAALAGGVAVLALLVWLSDEPGRVAGGERRAALAIGIVGLIFGVTWFCAFLLPPTRVPTGVVGGLLVAVILLVTALLARPELLESEPPLSA
ncbi:MAG TPA: hypothetical protein VML94_02620 [Thermoplasmata archaeon]|nr:hypothetical protein [Thermoplasmata archaeon]